MKFVLLHSGNARFGDRGQLERGGGQWWGAKGQTPTLSFGPRRRGLGRGRQNYFLGTEKDARKNKKTSSKLPRGERGGRPKKKHPIGPLELGGAPKVPTKKQR